MKSLKQIIFGISFLACDLTLAQVEGVRTPLWQVPSVKEMKLQIEALDPKLKKICSEYRDLVVAEPGQEVFDKGDIERLRNETANVFDKAFTTKFKISQIPGDQMSRNLVLDANTKVEALKNKDLLPYYTLRLSEISSVLQPLGPVVVYWSGSSLSSISKSVGLKPLSINVVPGPTAVSVVVRGKDTACDLLSGDGWLEFDVKAKLTPDSNDLEEVEKFYGEVADLNNQWLIQRKTPNGRAAIFGFKMEGILKSHHVESSRDEEILGYYVENLFDLEMGPNQFWQKQSDQTWGLPVSRDVNTQIKVTLKR